MANKHENLVALFSDIADAIRSRTGESGAIVADNFPEAIQAITAGLENVVPFVAPKGRMLGDINGDGVITTADYDLVVNHTKGTTITDEIAFWCADTNADGKISSSDSTYLLRYINGTTSGMLTKPTMADYYGNWSWFKVDDASGYFYCDVAVEGMTAESSALLIASAYADCFIGVECGEGFARVKAERLPLDDTDCIIVWEADGTEWESADGGFKTVNIDIPFGRMVGDINGDGIIDEADETLVFDHIAGATITDEIGFWCADIDSNGRLSAVEKKFYQTYLDGTRNLFVTAIGYGKNPDYYNNWNYYQSDDLNGYFYKDFPIEGITANSTAIFLVSDYADIFIGAECGEGFVRIKAERCPLTDCKGLILWKKWEQKKTEVVVPNFVSVEVDESGLVTATSGEKVVTKQLTTQAETTVTPSEEEQVAVASGVYTTGAITVGAIPSNYIVPNGTKEITKNGTYDIASFAEAIVNVAGSGGGNEGYTGDLYSFGTAIATPPSGATSTQFTDIPKQPDFFICYVDTFNVEQYHRAGVVVYDGETVYGQEIYSGTDDCYLRENTNTASSYYYKFSYSGTTLTLSSAGTNNGGYFHNPGTYTLIYAYKDNENGTVAIDKKKVTAAGGASLTFDEMEGNPVWYSAILKANQDAQAASSSTVMYVNESGCTRMENASSKPAYTFTSATGLGTYSDGTLTLTPGSAEFAAKEYTLIYAYVPDFGGFEIFDIELPFGRMKGDVDGDGKVSSIDTNTIMNIVNKTEAAPSDEIAFWCADFNGDGYITSTDSSLCTKFVNKSPSSYIAEYYGNWTWLQEGDFGCFYRDIPIEGMTKDSTAILAVQKSAELFQVPECFDGFLRIKATYCPGTNVKATVFWKKHETIKSKPIGEPVDLSCTLKIVDNSDGSGYFDVVYQTEAGIAPANTEKVGEYKALSKGILYVYKEDLSVSYVNAGKVDNTVRYIDVEPGGVCTVTFS